VEAIPALTMGAKVKLKIKQFTTHSFKNCGVRKPEPQTESKCMNWKKSLTYFWIGPVLKRKK
jgi:hypothetical protein